MKKRGVYPRFFECSVVSGSVEPVADAAVTQFASPRGVLITTLTLVGHAAVAQLGCLPGAEWRMRRVDVIGFAEGFRHLQASQLECPAFCGAGFDQLKCIHGSTSSAPVPPLPGAGLTATSLPKLNVVQP